MDQELIVNDTHSALNQTRVARLRRPDSIDSLLRVVRAARREGRSISVCGARHAMGGQQFRADHDLIDCTGLDRVLSLDHDRGIVTAEAGLCWPELLDACDDLQSDRNPQERWGIQQKQTGADRLTLGGALSANAHGRGLTMPPIIADVESFDLVTPDGELITCSREHRPDLFALAIGGYGLFGVIARVSLRLSRRRALRRVVRVIDIEDAEHAARRRIDEGFLYGDFQFDIDPRSSDFLTKGVFSCYEPIEDALPDTHDRKELRPDDWLNLLLLAHTDKRRAFEFYAQHYLTTDGQTYWSDRHQLGVYLDGYHERLDAMMDADCRCTEMITELYVPHESLVTFLREAAAGLTRREADVIYGTIRLIAQDRESFLPWAREPFACVIFNLHVRHTPDGIEHAAGAFRALIDLALDKGGSFYLTYHRFATREQLLAAHPKLPDFINAKLAHDPAGIMTSDWWTWLVNTLDD